jgi:nitrate/nitrite transporter NarK
MSTAKKGRVWSLYGWFCGLITFGSFVGIFTWIARMQQLVNNLEGSELLAQAIQSDTYFGNDLYRPSPLFNPYQQHCCCAFKTALP